MLREWFAIPTRNTAFRVELPSRVHRRLDGLRALVEAENVVEVVRRALAVYDVLVVATRCAGEQVILRSSAGTERELKIP